MLFCDITGLEIGDTRKNTDFILVYNEINRPMHPNEQRAKRMAELSNLPYIRFNLGSHEGFCFRKIRTFDRTEFKKWVLEALPE